LNNLRKLEEDKEGGEEEEEEEEEIEEPPDPNALTTIEIMGIALAAVATGVVSLSIVYMFYSFIHYQMSKK